VPLRARGHLQREHGAGNEPALRSIRIELDFDRALEPVRLRQATDPQLSVGWLGGSWVCHRLEVGVDDVDAHLAAIGESRDQGAKRLRRAAGAPDHATEVLGVHAHLENLAAWRVLRDNLHLVRVIDDPLDQVFESGSEQGLGLVGVGSGHVGVDLCSELCAGLN